MVTDLSATPIAPLAGDQVLHHFRKRYSGDLILNVGIDREHGNRLWQGGAGDLIAVGREYIVNPDLVERIRLNAPAERAASGRPEQSQIAGEVQLVMLKSRLETGDELAAKHTSEYSELLDRQDPWPFQSLGAVLHPHQRDGILPHFYKAPPFRTSENEVQEATNVRLGFWCKVQFT